MVKRSMTRRDVVPLALLAQLLLSFLCALAAGCAMPAAKPAGVVAAPAPAAAAGAQAALQAALRGYEQDDFKPLQALLPVRFNGRGPLLEAAQTMRNAQTQVRITLTEMTFQQAPAGSGAVALSARWDKRFLKLPALTPTAETGALQALLRPEAGRWVLEALSPDNPFTR